MNYRTPNLERQRAAHIAECQSRRAPHPVRAETLAEYMARGAQIERLPPNAVSQGNELKGRYE